MSILSELTEITRAAFVTCEADPTHSGVVYSQRPELCQFQCNGAMPAAKSVGMNPRELAETIAKLLSESEVIEKVEIAGPGFLNIDVTPEFLTSVTTRAASSPSLGIEPFGDSKVVIDYGGANVAKSLHVGHLRTALIGESIKRTYAVAGFDVKGDVHLGDWGLPMGQIIAWIEDTQPDLPFFDKNFEGEYPTESPVTIEDLEKLYPEASARCKEDKDFAEKAQLITVALQDSEPGYLALWQLFRDLSAKALEETYASLGVSFELWLGEASVASRIDKMIERIAETGVSKVNDGALIIEVEQESDTQEIPPLMLLNSRGGLTYGTTDIATIEERVDDFGFNKSVYIVDARQSLHFEQVFRAARLSKIAPAEFEMIHAANGTVNGPNGKPLKTRDGNLPKLNDLVVESGEMALSKLNENELAQDFSEDERKTIANDVGIAALAYGELSNHRTTNYNFDLDRFTQLKGQTGPYLQYVTVRAASTLRKAEQAGLKPGSFTSASHESEKSLALTLLKAQEVVERTIDQHAPNLIAEYAYEVASKFNQFYDQCHIISEPDKAVQESWLALVEFCEKMLRQLCYLLCIPVPERM